MVLYWCNCSLHTAVVAVVSCRALQCVADKSPAVRRGVEDDKQGMGRSYSQAESRVSFYNINQLPKCQLKTVAQSN